MNDVVTWTDSTQGMRVALHDFGGPANPLSPVILFSHATGFNALSWRTVAARLTDRFRCVGVDLRGHGLSELVPTASLEWHHFGDDVLAALDALGPSPRAIHGVGHSMGGAALIMAASRSPASFRSLWLFEPIVGRPEHMGAGNANPMSAAAARRRPDFDSLQAAFDNFASKAPLNQLHRDALRAYVEGGFAPTGDGSVTLRCRPATEAAIFAAAPTSGAWEEALRVAVATRVLSGRTDDGGPALFAEHLANALVDGSLAVHRELGHFGPLEDPDAMSVDIAAWITEHGER